MKEELKEEWEEELRMLFYMRPQYLSNADFYWEKAKKIITTQIKQAEERGIEQHWWEFVEEYKKAEKVVGETRETSFILGLLSKNTH